MMSRSIRRNLAWGDLVHCIASYVSNNNDININVHVDIKIDIDINVNIINVNIDIATDIDYWLFAICACALWRYFSPGAEAGAKAKLNFYT